VTFNPKDSRIELLDDLIEKNVPHDHFCDDGTERRFYSYVWFHGPVAIYVGKGCGPRYLKFVVAGYNSVVALAYVRKHFKELECFFAASEITESASFAIEHMLIGYFRLRSEGGSLLNGKPGRLPAPGSGADLSHLRQTASLAPLPPNLEPLANGKHVLAWKRQPTFAPTDRLTLTTDNNPWAYNTPGYRFFEAVMRQRPATVADAISMAKAHDGGKVRTERIGSAQGHLRWLYTWGPHLIVNDQFWRPSPEAGIRQWHST
jgi:hypothetical protein